MSEEPSYFASEIGNEHSIEWVRASERYPDRSLFGTAMNGNNAINEHDITQGEIGNCWVLASLAAFAEYEPRVQNTFVNTETNDKGIYAINLYRLGVPNTVVIDDYLALMDGTNRTIYTQLSQDNGLWGPLIEKAFAKFHGNFLHLHGGWPSEAVETLNGSPSTWIYHDNQHNEDSWWVDQDNLQSKEQIFNKLLECDPKKAIMTTGTPCGGYQMDNGLIMCHAYSVMRAFELDVNGRTEKLIEVRNPWGAINEHDAGFMGRWHDNADIWTDELRDAAGHQNENDGTFIMDYEEFANYFTETWVNPSTIDWSHDYFL